MTRAQLEALAWRHTHRDFRGKYADGTKTVCKLVEGVGTCVVPLASLTDDELVAKIPRSVREQCKEALAEVTR